MKTKSSTAKSEDVQTVLPAFVSQAIEDASTGDSKAWGTIYSAAATYAKAGLVMPPALEALVTARLQALGKALLKPPATGAESAVFDAAAPHPISSRKPGAKPKALSAKKLAIDVLSYHDSGMALKTAARKVSSLLPLDPKTGQPIYSPETLLIDAKKLRKQQRS